MNRQQASIFPILFSLLISIIGLALIFAIVSQPNLENPQPLVERSLIGVLFCALCLLGIAAVFFPTKCRGAFQHAQNIPAKINTVPKPLKIKGHHPDCQNFSSNRIKVGEQLFVRHAAAS